MLGKRFTILTVDLHSSDLLLKARDRLSDHACREKRAGGAVEGYRAPGVIACDQTLGKKAPLKLIAQERFHAEFSDVIKVINRHPVTDEAIEPLIELERSLQSRTRVLRTLGARKIPARLCAAIDGTIRPHAA